MTHTLPKLLEFKFDFWASIGRKFLKVQLAIQCILECCNGPTKCYFKIEICLLVTTENGYV